MPTGTSRLWLAAGGLLLFAAGVGLLALRPPPSASRPGAATTAGNTDAGCASSAEAASPDSPRGSALVMFEAKAPVRLFIDGAALPSQAQPPTLLSSGEHSLRAEAPGAEPLTTRFRIDPFAPALFHAELDPAAGLTLVRLGAICASCAAATDLVELHVEPSSLPPSALLTQAAAALRRDDWRTAAASLRGVPGPERRAPLYRRLAAAVYLATDQPSKAREELFAAAGLRLLLDQLTTLRSAELRREKQAVVERWNRLTERFGRLVDRFGPLAPGPVNASSTRMAELSKAFAEANLAGALEPQEAALAAAGEVVSTLTAQLQASRPADCAFQNDLAGALSP